ncbi:MAG: helix-turn-helix domain-containing protein [Anaerolineae bacterium]
MSLVHIARASDSPYVDTVMHGHTLSAGVTVRPAENHWHMIVSKHDGGTNFIITGALTTSGIARWGADGEILWIRFKLGTFMPNLPAKVLLNKETILPNGAFQSFWLGGSTWQLPNYENADAFVDRLMHNEVLAYDPTVEAALNDQPQILPERTLRHRFLRATGLSQTHIRQMERAQRAQRMLEQGISILDTIYDTGYFDQPHLTRSLKRFVGKTPAQILNSNQPQL